MNTRITTALIVAALSFHAGARAGETNVPSQQQIETWVKELGDDHYQVRQTAEANLKLAGARAKQALESVADLMDAEVKVRTERLLLAFKAPELFQKMKTVLAQAEKGFEADFAISLAKGSYHWDMDGHVIASPAKGLSLIQGQKMGTPFVAINDSDRDPLSELHSIVRHFEFRDASIAFMEDGREAFLLTGTKISVRGDNSLLHIKDATKATLYLDKKTCLPLKCCAINDDEPGLHVVVIRNMTLRDNIDPEVFKRTDRADSR